MYEIYMCLKGSLCDQYAHFCAIYSCGCPFYVLYLIYKVLVLAVCSSLDGSKLGQNLHKFYQDLIFLELRPRL